MYDGVQFNCTVNWLARNQIPSNTTIILEYVIISLHLGIETYTKLMLPPGAEKSTYLSSVCVLMNSLCFSEDFNGTDFVIWKMTEFGDDRSWTQFFTFSYHNLQMNLNSRVVYSWSWLMLWKCEKLKFISLECNNRVQEVFIGVQSFYVHAKVTCLSSYY
jgi:hypothetical protein